jgi:hypothetical protein
MEQGMFLMFPEKREENFKRLLLLRIVKEAKEQDNLSENRLFYSLNRQMPIARTDFDAAVGILESTLKAIKVYRFNRSGKNVGHIHVQRSAIWDKYVEALAKIPGFEFWTEE